MVTHLPYSSKMHVNHTIGNTCLGSIDTTVVNLRHKVWGSRNIIFTHIAGNSFLYEHTRDEILFYYTCIYIYVTLGLCLISFSVFIY